MMQILQAQQTPNSVLRNNDPLRGTLCELIVLHNYYL